ncbi:LLM class flavin-dependent oxidoreductase [Nonomuraea sp. NPDC048916]|uniref:LLM class flavin-dependent oxidoreductase n=1 Tax=Nonomuraea sp. NPDC048916 TaxID=3154232 RepID=UPI0033C1BBB0
MSDLARARADQVGHVTVGLGLFTGQHPRGGRPLYRQAPELAHAAEANGFDMFWVSEHHGLADGYLPSPLTLLAAVAMRTRRIGLGTGLAIAPLYHPIRLAEDAAVVDDLSGGRLTLGLGIGYARHEYAAFDVGHGGRGARLADLVGFLRRAWQGDAFDWDGPAISARGLRVAPRPVAETGVPVWLGGYAPAAVRRAGTLADGYLIGRGDRPIVEAAAAQVASVRAPGDPTFTMGVNLLVALAGTPEQDRALRDGFHHQQAVYERIQQGLDVFAGHVQDPATPLTPAGAHRYFHAVGTADEVVDQIRRAVEPLRAWANVHIVIRALVPEPDLVTQLARVDRLGERVLPGLA